MRVLHWFRKGLRLHDNAALLAALNPPNWKPIGGERIELFFAYVLDPMEDLNAGVRRRQFLLESLRVLDKSLAKLNKNYRLLVFRGNPETVGCSTLLSI